MDSLPFNWIHFEGRNAVEEAKMIDHIQQIVRGTAASRTPAGDATGRPSRLSRRAQSYAVNRRYPDGVRSGVTSPSASRKRILEMVTSGKSGRSRSRTAPIDIPARAGLSGAVTLSCPGRCRRHLWARSRRPGGTCRSAPRRRWPAPRNRRVPG